MQWLVDIFLKLFGMWLSKTPAPIIEAEKAGAAQQQVQNLQKANDDVQKAVQAADAVRAADAADPGRLRDPSDPDCRDCEAQ